MKHIHCNEICGFFTSSILNFTLLLATKVYREVPHIWQPAECYPQCYYANNRSFMFCQRCGFQKEIPPLLHQQPIDIPLSCINTRLQEIQSTHSDRPYKRQKSSLHKELEIFLASLPHPKTFIAASPNDLLRFLIWKDNVGRTKLHSDPCLFFGSYAKRTPCACPTRLAWVRWAISLPN